MSLCENDAGVNSQLNIKNDDRNTKEKKTNESLKISDKVELCNNAMEPVPEEQTSHQNLSKVRVIPKGELTSSDVKPNVVEDLETLPSSSGVEVKETCPDCTECRIHRRDPTRKELSICLHAAVYKGPDWEYRCPWPPWALPKEQTQKENKQI